MSLLSTHFRRDTQVYSSCASVWILANSKSNFTRFTCKDDTIPGITIHFFKPIFPQCPYLGNVTHPYLAIGQVVCLPPTTHTHTPLPPWFPGAPGRHHLIWTEATLTVLSGDTVLQQLHLVSHTCGQWGCHGSEHHLNTGRLAARQAQVVGNPVLLVSSKTDKTPFMTIQ